MLPSTLGQQSFPRDDRTAAFADQLWNRVHDVRVSTSPARDCSDGQQ